MTKLEKQYYEVKNNCKRILINEGRASGIFFDPKNQKLPVGDNCDTEELARKNLLEKVKDLPYIKVILEKTGVKWIEVDDGWKITNYTIHARHSNEVVGQELSHNLFGEKYLKDKLAPIIYAYLFKHDSYFKDDKNYDLSKFEEYNEICKKLDEYFENKYGKKESK